MAASITVGEDIGNGVHKITYTWTSAADGTVSGSTTNAYTGKVRRIITDPDGTAAPTADYDITIADSDGYDLLDGNGANRATATTEVVAPSGIVVGSTLTLSVENAGDTKQGVVIVYVTDDMS